MDTLPSKTLKPRRKWPAKLAESISPLAQKSGAIFFAHDLSFLKIARHTVRIVSI